MPVPWTPNRYPKARRSDHIDTYQSATKGTVRVHDPYNWLEEHTEETDKWTSEQEVFTRAYLDQNPDRKRLEEAFRTSVDYPKFSAPTLHDDNRWYWHYNSGLQHQYVIYRTADDKLPEFKDGSEPGEVFFDPNLLSDDGSVALRDYRISKSGKLMVYALSKSGSDEFTIYVRPTDAPLNQKEDTGRLPDEIKFVKFSTLSWTPDSKGFFYQRYPNQQNGLTNGLKVSTDENAMIYYHRIGTDQSEDILIHRDEDHPTWMFGTDVTEDDKYLILYTSKDTSRKNLIWVADLEKVTFGNPIQWKKVFDTFDAEYSCVANDGSIFYFYTNENASQYKLISVDISADKPQPTVVIPERKDALLCGVIRVDDNRFVVKCKRNVKDELYIYDNNGTQLERLFPDYVGTMSAHCRADHSWLFITMTGFTTPGVISYYDFKRPDGQRITPFRQIEVEGLSADDFETRQVWYPSKDGTQVPMFIVRHKSTPFDGTAPAIQYGYGGFSVNVDPFFSPVFLAFIQIYGGIIAVPNIRGGSEFGEDWHQGACRENKKNCFDDFIAATEYLVKNKYAAPGKVAINGGSNGGLLVAACINRAPEGTFGAAVAEVGVLDLLKFHKFTIGNAWTSDYGDPDSPQDFDFIYPISPLHNVPNRVLPPFILLTADHDDRVVPMHSFKYAATLQHTVPNNPHPLLLRVDKKAGHGAGKSVEKRIQESSDKWGFVAQTLGLVWKDKK
uniref:Prolyl endopeptidase n=1 Tax=Lepiota venenata TaxID=2136145 RepID=A0A650AW12_9AGAR|nr:prolyl oligopeptidase [Lepiota venenata]QKM76209.1 prolyl oligopeptidase [Lepiota venenata]